MGTILDTGTSVCEVTGSAMKRILLRAHPIGSYYWSSENVDPTELFGGTWVQITGRFLYAVDDSHPVGGVGGEEDHVLTIDELPDVGLESNLQGAHAKYADYTGVPVATIASAWDQTWSPIIKLGKGQAHQNMPPYLCAYCWRRTS